MARLPTISLGRGRSSVTRSIAAFVLAPMVAALPVAAGLFLVANHGILPLPEPASAVHGVIGMAEALLKLTLAFGLPTWAALRLIRFESGWIYCMLGFAEASGAAIFFISDFNDYFRSDLIGDFLSAGIIGAVVALLFWAIARDPKEAVSTPSSA